MDIPQSSAGWIRYFGSNAGNLLRLDWHLHEPLPVDELQVIARSLKVFQLGESSEGKSLLRFTQHFAEKEKDPELVEAMAKFIAEENRHANWLGKFLELEGVSRAKRNWTDHIFRLIRRGANLEICLSVLLTAELVARVYYHALYLATHSHVLRQICRQLLRDEMFHVYFHTHLLRKIHNHRSAAWRKLWIHLFRFFHAVTILVVWKGHRSVLKKAEFSFLRYWRTSQRYCSAAVGLLDEKVTLSAIKEGQGERYVDDRIQPQTTLDRALPPNDIPHTRMS